MADPEKKLNPPVQERVPVEIKKLEHKNIYEALSAFQGELKTMPKSATVKFATQKGGVEFNYTPLGEIMSTIYPILAKHGLSVRHEIVTLTSAGGNDTQGVEAILTHSTYKEPAPIFVTEMGKRVEGELEIEPKGLQRFDTSAQNEIRSGIVKLKGGGEMKDTGAAITYARRYTLTMLLGISSEDDKDAELLEQSAKNAQGFTESRARQSIENAKTVAEVEKAAGVIKKDLELLAKGKAGALGLTKEVYEEILILADDKIKELNNPSGQGA